MNIASLFRFDIKLYNFLLTPKSVVAKMYNRRAITEAAKNSSLKNIALGKTLYICGNGPSLNKVDMKDIKEDYLVVNDYYRFKYKDDNHPPKYYMILDESFLDPEFNERFNNVFNPGFITTYVLNGMLLDRVSKQFPDINVIYFCPWGKLYSSKREFRFDKVHGRPWNVIGEAILFGIFLGYKEIRLLGCDYSLFSTSAHFYSEQQNRPCLQEMLYKYCFTTEVHYEIEKYAREKNVKIINMTTETLLDAYEIDKSSIY